MKTKIFLVALALALLIPASAALAFELKQSDGAVNVSSDQTIDDNLIATGASVVIDGTVNGNVYTAAQTVTVNGTINGDLFAGAQSVNIAGKVNGHLFAGASDVTVTGEIKDDLYVGAGTMNINNTKSRNAVLAGGMVQTNDQAGFSKDLFVFAGSATINGEVGQDLKVGAGEISVNNKIGRNAKLESSDSVTLGSNAIVDGNLDYTAAQEVSKEDGAQVKGETVYTPVEKAQKDTKDKGKDDKKPAIPFLPFAFFGIIIKIIGFIGLLVIAILTAAICKNYTKIFIEKLQTKTWPALGWGFLTLVATPIVILILLVIIIGIPIGLLLIPMYVILLYFAKVFASICTGFVIIKALGKKEPHLIWSAVLGVIVISILLAIPFLGGLVKLVVLAFGIGGIILALKEYSKSTVKDK